MLTQEATLLNASNYLQQKFNLIWSHYREVFLIPTFSFVATPIATAENEKYYLLFFKINYIYRNFHEGQDELLGEINDLIFQYDVNFSKKDKASGQILISKKLSFGFKKSQKITDYVQNHDNSVTFNNGKVNNDWTVSYIRHKFFKIMIPASIIKNNENNIFNYSFTSKINQYDPDNTHTFGPHINSKSNYGSLNFYFNDQPNFQISTNVDLFNKYLNHASIVNPVIFQTYAPKVDDNYEILESSDPRKVSTGRLRTGSIADEVFEYEYNNINTTTLVPFKIKHYLRFNSIIDDLADIRWYFIKFNIFHNAFNLQSNSMVKLLNLFDNKLIVQIPVNLSLFEEKINDSNEIIDSQMFVLSINKAFLDKEINENFNNLLFPLNQPFSRLLNFEFNFKTFFNYKISLNIVQKSDKAIINERNGLIIIAKEEKPELNISWIINSQFIFSDEEINFYYTTNNFTLAEFEKMRNLGA